MKGIVFAGGNGTRLYLLFIHNIHKPATVYGKEAMRYAIDATKIINELGWEPTVQLEEGIEKDSTLVSQ